MTTPNQLDAYINIALKTITNIGVKNKILLDYKKLRIDNSSSKQDIDKMYNELYKIGIFDSLLKLVPSSESDLLKEIYNLKNFSSMTLTENTHDKALCECPGEKILHSVTSVFYCTECGVITDKHTVAMEAKLLAENNYKIQTMTIGNRADNSGLSDSMRHFNSIISKMTADKPFEYYIKPKDTKKNNSWESVKELILNSESNIHTVSSIKSMLKFHKITGMVDIIPVILRFICGIQLPTFSQQERVILETEFREMSFGEMNNGISRKKYKTMIKECVKKHLDPSRYTLFNKYGLFVDF